MNNESTLVQSGQAEQGNTTKKNGGITPVTRPGSKLDENVINGFKEQAKGHMPPPIPLRKR